MSYGELLVKIPTLKTEQKFFLITCFVGLIAGLVAVALTHMAHGLSKWAGTYAVAFTWKSFLVGGVFMTISALMCKRYPYLAGSGIPRTRLQIAMSHGMITAKEWILKFFTTLFALASGVPLGIEAPTIAISAGVGSTLARRFFSNPKQVRELVYIGCSAGIAAAFNTPIAAVIFTMEEIIGNMSARSMAPILIASLVASVTAATINGENSIFIVTAHKLNNPTELFYYLGLGIAAGIAGPLFVRNIVAVKRLSKKVFKHHFLTPMIIGFLITGLFSLIHSRVPGPGIRLVNELLMGQSMPWQELAALALLKFLASAFCYGAGISGGILLPTMVIGAVFGGLWGQMVDHFHPQTIEMGAYALVGIGTFLAGVIKAPFTSIVLVFEMTRDYRIVLPLMLANLVAWLLAEKQFKGSIYDFMANLEGLDLPSHDEDELHQLNIADIYRPEKKILTAPLTYAKKLYPDQSISSALAKLSRQKFQHELVVVNRLNPLEQLGVIRLQDIIQYLQEQENPLNELRE